MKLDRPRLGLGLLAVIVVSALIVAGSTSTAAFGAFNADWDGAADLQEFANSMGADHRTLFDASGYDPVDANESVAVVLAPETAYGDDANQVRAFLERGGTLVVAEDTGTGGNALLENIGASGRVDNRLLRDEHHNYRSPAMPVATNVSEDPLTEGVDALSLNYGSVVRPNGTTVLVNSSEFAYLDTNANGALDETESLQRYPVVTSERIGDGRVVVVSDPSIFINVMLDRKGNKQFVENLLDVEEVLVDYSHAGGQPPFMFLLLTLRNSPAYQSLVGLAGIGLGLLAIRSSKRLSPDDTRAQPPIEHDELNAYLAEEHPEWDSDRIERVTAGILAIRENSGTNEPD